MKETRNSQPRRKSVQRAINRTSGPTVHQTLLDKIAANRGLKVFEREGLIWATDGQSEWVFHKPVKPRGRWFTAWQIAYLNPAALDKK